MIYAGISQIHLDYMFFLRGGMHHIQQCSGLTCGSWQYSRDHKWCPESNLGWPHANHMLYLYGSLTLHFLKVEI